MDLSLEWIHVKDIENQMAKSMFKTQLHDGEVEEAYISYISQNHLHFHVNSIIFLLEHLLKQHTYPLCHVGQLNLLKKLYNEIMIPRAVYRELSKKKQSICKRQVDLSLEWIHVKDIAKFHKFFRNINIFFYHLLYNWF